MNVTFNEKAFFMKNREMNWRNGGNWLGASLPLELISFMIIVQGFR